MARYEPIFDIFPIYFLYISSILPYIIVAVAVAVAVAAVAAAAAAVVVVVVVVVVVIVVVVVVNVKETRVKSPYLGYVRYKYSLR